MPITVLGGTKVADTAFSVDNSCMFNIADSPYMYKTVVSPTSATISTISFWMKAMGVTDSGIFAARTDTNNRHSLYWEGGGGAKLELWGKRSGSATVEMHLTRAFRDPSAWIHNVIAIDTTQATAGNRVKWYVNGTRQTVFTTETQATEDSSLEWSVADATIAVGAYAATGGFSSYFDGYLAEFVFIDGTQYAASDFGEFSEDSPNVWIPKKVSGLTFGNNGFYLDFKDSSNLGNDANGGTDLTESGLAATDQMTDTPTNNYAVVNPLFRNNLGGVTFTEGNLKFAETNSPSESTPGASTIAVANGKWYFEVYCEEDEGEDKFWIGASTVESAQNVLTGAGVAHLWGLRTGSTGVALYNDVVYRTAGGSYSEVLTAGLTGGAASDGEIIKMAIDLDNGKVWFGKDDEWSNGSASISSTLDASNHDTTVTAGTEYYLGCGGEGCICWANFGSPARAISSGNADANGYGNFEYAVPSGFYALNTKNLAEFG